MSGHFDLDDEIPAFDAPAEAPEPVCAVCADTGWLQEINGGVTHCPACDACYREPSPATGRPRYRSEDW